MLNKHLQDAVRYLHFTHNIIVKEKTSNDSLALIIENIVDQMDSAKLREYWQAYELETYPQAEVQNFNQAH